MAPSSFIPVLILLIVLKCASGAPNELSAQKAIDEIGANINAVARAYGIGDGNADALKKTLLADKDLRWDSLSNKLLYACSGNVQSPGSNSQADSGNQAKDRAKDPGKPAASTQDFPSFGSGLLGMLDISEELEAMPFTMSEGSEPVTGVLPGQQDPVLSEALRLHSRPNAKNIILLDFTGHSTTNSAWNKASGRPATIVTPPFDLDGSLSSFSSNELRAIVSDTDGTRHKPVQACHKVFAGSTRGGLMDDCYAVVQNIYRFMSLTYLKRTACRTLPIIHQHAHALLHFLMLALCA